MNKGVVSPASIFVNISPPARIMTPVISLLQLLVSSQAPLTDDLYLEGRSSGDLPIDDEDREDDGSGSGSGDYGERTTNFTLIDGNDLGLVLLHVLPESIEVH